jgi:pimeloyl-ACP methyl ester carboxylesterase
MTLAAPERILSLSLHSTLGRLYPAVRRRFEVMIPITEGGDPDLWAEARTLTAYSHRHLNAHDEELKAEVASLRAQRKAMTPEQVEGLLGQYRAILTFDPWERLGEIGVPTLVTVGSDDAVTPPDYARALHERIPGSRLHVFQGCPYHWTLIHAAEEFNRVSMAYLTDLVRGPSVSPR